jgi:hypothetical protein
VRKVELGGTWGISPPLTIGVTADAYLKGSDGTLIYEQTFTHAGSSLEPGEWTGGIILQETDVALSRLSKRVVDEVFALHLRDDHSLSSR